MSQPPQQPSTPNRSLLAPGTVLFSKGEPGDRAFVIERAHPTSVAADAEAPPASIVTLGRGAVLLAPAQAHLCTLDTPNA